MTPAEARSRIATLTAPLNAGSTSADYAAATAQLRQLMLALPNTPEFDGIARAIADLTPRLSTATALEAVKELRERTDALAAANALLAKTATDARNDARTLRFEGITIVVNGLKNAADAVMELRTAVQDRDLAAVDARAKELLELIEYLQSLAKSD